MDISVLDEFEIPDAKPRVAFKIEDRRFHDPRTVPEIGALTSSEESWLGALLVAKNFPRNVLPDGSLCKAL